MRLTYSKSHRRVANNTQYASSPSNFKSVNHSDNAFFSAFDPDYLPTKVTSKSKDGDYKYVIYTERKHSDGSFKKVMGSTGETQQ
jgi:hypothetical protein